MSKERVGGFIDPTLTMHVRRRRSLYNDHDGTNTEQEREDPVPEEIMSELEPLMGDGEARVTVSGALSSSQEYHKAEAFVSVSVACNNDMGDIEKTHDLIRPFVQSLVHEDHEEMSKLRDTLLPPHQRKHTEKEATPPKKGAPTGLPPAKVASPPAKSKKPGVSVKGKVKKPSFKR